MIRFWEIYLCARYMVNLLTRCVMKRNEQRKTQQWRYIQGVITPFLISWGKRNLRRVSVRACVRFPTTRLNQRTDFHETWNEYHVIIGHPDWTKIKAIGYFCNILLLMLWCLNILS
jgi:hypothetical protein